MFWDVLMRFLHRFHDSWLNDRTLVFIPKNPSLNIYLQFLYLHLNLSNNTKYKNVN